MWKQKILTQFQTSTGGQVRLYQDKWWAQGQETGKNLIFSEERSLDPVCVCVCVHAQPCPTLCDPMDCSPPGSSIHGISQARILEWVAISYSRGSSRPRDQTHISCIGKRICLSLSHLGHPLDIMASPKKKLIERASSSDLLKNYVEESQPSKNFRFPGNTQPFWVVTC